MASVLVLAGSGVGLRALGQVRQDAPPIVISDNDVELYGQFAWLWQQSDKTHVVQYQGDFRLRMGDRQMTSHDAVIWIGRDVHRGRAFHELTIVLVDQATVVEPGGTVSTGPTLVVTLRSYGKVLVNADATSRETTADTLLFLQAERAAGRSLPEQPSVEPPSPTEPSGPEPGVEQPAREGVVAAPKVRRPVSCRAKGTLVFSSHGDEPVVLAKDDVYVWRVGSQDEPFLELRAEAVVLFLGQDAKSRLSGMVGGEPGSQTQPASDQEEPAQQERTPSQRFGISGGGFQDEVRGAYLTGDVVLTQGDRMIRASELYFDFEHNRALILDAVMRVYEPTRNVPIYVRAVQARQLSTTEYVAYDALVTTSEFYTPHYAVGADEIRFVDTTSREPNQPDVTVAAGTYTIKNSRLEVMSVPLLYWPYSKGQFKTGEMPLQRVRTGYDSDFGTSIETRWHTFSLLGMVEPEGIDSSLLVDYYSDRGPAGGLDADYQGDNYFGLLRSYYVYDSGTDKLGGRRQVEFDDQDRGRALLRHRHMLGKGWEITGEISYISDPTFLEEWFEPEYDEGKPQETLLYLKKQQDNWAVTSLLQWRILDFETQTEHLPDTSFYWLGESFGPVALFSESHGGAVRYRPDDRLGPGFDRLFNMQETDVTVRGDTRQELNVPVSLGPVRVVPFASARVTHWDGAPQHEGSRTRGFFTEGIRGSMNFWRVYDDVESRLLDLHRMRHEIKPDVAVWFAQSNMARNDMTPFDEGIEDLQDFSGVTVGLRQRWQTKRGGPGQWRSVDWLTADVEVGVFDDVDDGAITDGKGYWSRPELSRARNYVGADLTWRVSDSTALLYKANWDMTDGKMAVQNLALAVERLPRLAYFFGWGMVDESDTNVLGFGANYHINKKHTLAFRTFYDIEHGRTEDVVLTFLRKFPRMYVALTFELDKIEDSSMVSLSVWPEGMPEAAVGSKRYVDLATSTGIRPD